MRDEYYESDGRSSMDSDDSIASYPSSLELPALHMEESAVDMVMVPHIDPINPFAFTADQLVQVVDQKHLKFLEKMGGIEGIATGLHSNIKRGISWSESNLPYIRMYHLENQDAKEENAFENQLVYPLEIDETFVQRRSVFGTNILPKIEEASLLQLMLASFKDKTLVCLFIKIKSMTHN
jgi:Ca2+-transporting ATPase